MRSRPRRPLPALIAAVLLLIAVPALASAAESESSNPINDQGSSYNYRSEITSIRPVVSGLSVQVLQFADRLLMINHTGQTVTVFGYDNEPYARVLANGTAEQNTRSPATYLNKTFYGDINVPPQANAKAAPVWEVIDRTGELEWHDHRIHYTSPAIPPQVKDKSKRTLIFHWNVPIEVGAVKGSISGQLFWVPESSKTPLAAIIIGLVIVLGGLAFVVVVRRRRAGQDGGAGPGVPSPAPAGGPAREEAW